jgi:hypothetical protein
MDYTPSERKKAFHKHIVRQKKSTKNHLIKARRNEWVRKKYV